MAPSLHRHAALVDRLSVLIHRRALLAAGLALLPGAARAVCTEPGNPCVTDNDCCHKVCDNGVCRAFVDVCQVSGGNGRALGAPCDPRAGHCCWGARCKSTAGSGFPGGLPPYTCQPNGAKWRCPDGRRPCRSRDYSAMGPKQCCFKGDTCPNDERGCLSANCSIHNEMCQDVWSGGTCDGRWGFCALVTGGSVQCIDFEGFGTCPAGSECTNWGDCGPCEACVLSPPGCCQNPNSTLRYCAPLAGCAP